MIRAAYIEPKSNADVNQCVSLLHSSGYTEAFPDDPARVGSRITIWFNVETYSLDSRTDFGHPEIQPNQLYEFLTKGL